MSRCVTIVDYGVGNLLSVARAVIKVGGTPVVAADPGQIAQADRLILPGVGAFGDCVAALRERTGLEEAIIAHAASDRPLLGICVGMQILFDSSEEYGEHQGIGLIQGRVRAIPAVTVEGLPHKVPHIGWSPLEFPAGADPDCWSGTALGDISPGASVYFVHSFTAWPLHAEDRLADVHYNGQRIAAAVARNNICATQFHPEKSGPVGLAIIAAFLAR